MFSILLAPDRAASWDDVCWLVSIHLGVAPTGETFRRRLLLGADADRQLKDDEHRPHHLLQWKSQPAAGQWPVELSIQNKTAESVEVLWIDWQAEPQSYGVVAPGASFRQTTHAEHAWQSWLVRRPEGAGAACRQN